MSDEAGFDVFTVNQGDKQRDDGPLLGKPERLDRICEVEQHRAARAVAIHSERCSRITIAALAQKYRRSAANVGSLTYGKEEKTPRKAGPSLKGKENRRHAAVAGSQPQTSRNVPQIAYADQGNGCRALAARYPGLKILWLGRR